VSGNVFIAATGYTSEINPDADDLERIARNTDQRMLDADVWGFAKASRLEYSGYSVTGVAGRGPLLMGGFRYDTLPLQEDANALASGTREFTSVLGASTTETVVGFVSENDFSTTMRNSGVNILR